jgi:hypothetical protein
VFEAVACGVECALVDAENVVGELADAVCNGEAVHGAGGKDLEDQKIQCALQEFVGAGHLAFTSMIEVRVDEEDRQRKWPLWRKARKLPCAAAAPGLSHAISLKLLGWP